MRILLFSLFLGAVYSPIILSQENTIKAYSRAIMPSCEFVYQVETDFKIYLDKNVFSNHKDLALQMVLKNSWDKGPREQVLYFFPIKEKNILSFEGSYESMNLNLDFLFREAYLVHGFVNEDNIFTPEGPTYQVNLGRQMGEPCNRQRGPRAKFFERTITVVEEATYFDLNQNL